MPTLHFIDQETMKEKAKIPGGLGLVKFPESENIMFAETKASPTERI